MCRIEISAGFLGTVDSAVRVDHRNLWNTILTGRSGDVKQPGKVNSKILSDTRAAIEKGVEGESGTIELFRLEFLELEGTEISKISLVEGVCPTLKHLRINGCNDLVEVGALPPTLTSLCVSNCHKVRKMEGLYNLTNLQELDISWGKEVEELPCLERLTSLKKFTALLCSKLKRIRGLGQLTQLQVVNVSTCHALEELAGVEGLMLLERLNIRSCRKLLWSTGVLEQLRQRLKGGLKDTGMEKVPVYNHFMDYATGARSSKGAIWIIPDNSMSDDH